MYRDDSAHTSITIIIFIVAAIGSVIAFSKCSGGDHKSAEQEFTAWANALKLKHDGVVCNGHDSDGDGYVSCTYTVNGEARTVECASSFNMQHGCREPKPMLRSTTTINNSRR